MDPTATLALIRGLVAERPDDALAEAVADLDLWIARGGFLPRQWEEYRRVQVHHSAGCDLDGRTDEHEHSQAEHRAMLDRVTP